MITSLRFTIINVAAGLGLIGGLVIGAGPASAQVMCGDTIGVDTPMNAKLRADLLCSTDPALTLAGGARLNMRGFTVECENDGIFGIVLQGAGARLQNGTVAGCFIGVDLAGTGSHHVRKVTSRDNRSEGIEADSNDNWLVQNTAYGNGSDGFDTDGENNRLFRNLARDNGDGFELDGNNNILVRSLAHNNDDKGIDFDGSDGNRVWFNIVTSNRGPGIGLDRRSSSNQIRGNKVKDNDGDGIFVELLEPGEAGNNVVTNNRAFGNATDLVDQNPDCGNNVWRRNRFDTADPASCID